MTAPPPDPPRRRHRRWWLLAGIAALLAAAALAEGCTTLGYYSHLAIGEAHLLLQRKPIRKVIANPETSPRLRHRLELALRARAFASDVLKLPRNKSYTLYADIGRPFVMYNVFATPALSLQPVEHCFPIAGCVAYQGFYHLDRARARADTLRKQGDDVYIGGVPAYSTLGHFADPVLSSMDRWSTNRLIGTIFHELAHQELYVKGATAFNESFATFVQREGLRQFDADQHLQAPDPTRAEHKREFTQLVLATRGKLKALYASPLSDALKRKRKQAAFAALRQHYFHLRDTRWHGHGAWDQWIEAPLNNAKLLPFGLYDQYVPAFAALFRRCHGNWSRFYARVRQIGQGDAAARKRFLTSAPPTAHVAPAASRADRQAFGARGIRIAPVSHVKREAK